MSENSTSLVQFNFSEFTSEYPKSISKKLQISEGGELDKQRPEGMARGRVITATNKSMHEFADLLDRTPPDHTKTFSYGTCGYRKASIVTEKKLAKAERGFLIARTRNFFSFEDGPGIMMLDYDPPEGQAPMSSSQLLDAIYKICPAIKQAPHAVTASASSFIFHGDTAIKGIGGWHVYILVQNAEDIPRAGKAFFEMSWLADHGHIKISKAGSCLPRSIIDSAVFQPERLDFVSGSDCKPPLEQRRPKAERNNFDAPPLDTKKHLPDLNHTKKGIVEGLKQKAILAVAPEAEVIKQGWIERQVLKKLEKLPAKERRLEIIDELRHEFKDAVDGKCLGLNFILYPEDGGEITVQEILDSSSEWNGQRFADPLEPEYHNDNRIAYANLKGYGEPFIYSFAHGGVRYELSTKKIIKLQEGQRPQEAEAAIQQLKLAGNVYERGGELVQVHQSGKVVSLDIKKIQFMLDKLISWKVKRKGEWLPSNAKRHTADGVLANEGAWELPVLKQVTTMPTMVPETGRMIDHAGYDHETNVLVINNQLENWAGMPKQPSLVEVKSAFDTLWKPFEEFPLSTLDKSGVLAALLTVPLRPLLPTAPGFLISAPRASSGKTLLGKCIAHLTGATEVSTSPFSANAEEIRKRLLAAGKAGRRYLFFDNLSEPVKSDGLCSWLTNDIFNDRVLSESRDLNVTTRCMCLMTGNNLRVVGDLWRRMIHIFIDPEHGYDEGKIYKRNPKQYCKKNTLQMNIAALTILQAANQHELIPEYPTESFEEWSDTVRHTVCWLGREGITETCDPTLSMKFLRENDPERLKLKTVLSTWYKLFGETPQTSKKVVNYLNNQDSQSVDKQNLYDELSEFAGNNEGLNTNRVGLWLKDRVNRPIGGYKLVKLNNPGNVQNWQVKVV